LAANSLREVGHPQANERLFANRPPLRERALLARKKG